MKGMVGKLRDIFKEQPKSLVKYSIFYTDFNYDLSHSIHPMKFIYSS